MAHINKEYLFINLENIEKLLELKNPPKIIFKSSICFNKKSMDIKKLQTLCVKFANEHNLIILESKVRFTAKNEGIKKVFFQSRKLYF